MVFRFVKLVWCVLVLASVCLATSTSSSSDHTNNWAVLVSASRYWFNYRHMANTLGMYRTVKRLGIPDSQIILMLSDDVACNPRNSFPGTVYANADRKLDLYGERVEVDYRGYEVSVESFIRLLTGRHSPSTPLSKRLLTDDRSNVFVYLTGHGGDEFLKFQDNEEISAFDLADAFEQMWEKKRYNRMLFMVDTCEANTMYSKIYSPNILATGSAELGEPSFSHHNDPEIGVSVIDSFTHHLLSFMEGLNKTSSATFEDLFATYDKNVIRSSAGFRTDLFPVSLSSTKLTDFFGGVAQVDVIIPSSVPSAGSTGAPLDAANRPNQREIHIREGLALGQARRCQDVAKDSFVIQKNPIVGSDAVGQRAQIDRRSLCWILLGVGAGGMAWCYGVATAITLQVWLAGRWIRSFKPPEVRRAEGPRARA
ncbi:gpi-anchor transamidase [Phaffia rhodozyma]|uniref:Gpi-anchor transamidase n=1 Tax=Phaffia rhodozyma TaxID=264483 RepID=A0A0F7SLB5_PHARH|nr:gpi-anchor transamidase [Phaffia rhodozyma]